MIRVFLNFRSVQKTFQWLQSLSAFSNLLIMLLIILALLILVLYLYGTRTYNYWSDRNVPHRKPIPFFGNNFRNYAQLESRTQLSTALYKQYPNARFIGYYRGTVPDLIVRDPNLIKSIMATDFSTFYIRGVGRDPKYEPLQENLFHAEGDLWKMIRQRLTPAFTSGKLKNMFPLIVECAEQLQHLAELKCESGKPYDVRELMARFTTDFIGACGFGIKMNSINDSNSKFRELGKEMFTISFFSAVKLALKEMFPSLFGHLKPKGTVLLDSIMDILTGILEQRNYKPIGRNDFIDLLLELQNKGQIEAESIEHIDVNGKGRIVQREMDLKLMAAQVFVFFGAGFETSSSSTSYTLYQLAHNPHAQAAAQREVDQVLAKYNSKLCYEAVKEMTYLERAFYESLRMFPSLGILNRVCTKKYRIPDTDIWIDKGVTITIPVSAIQNDEKYFKNPEVFDPDRFLPEACEDRHKFVYLPFGEGPRACIGLRLGLMQSMAGLAALLQRFTFEPASVAGGSDQILVDPSFSTTQKVVGGIPLVIKRRK